MADFVLQVVGELPPMCSPAFGKGREMSPRMKAIYATLLANRGQWVLVSDCPRGPKATLSQHFSSLKRKGAKLAERSTADAVRVYAMLPKEGEESQPPAMG